MRTLVLASLLAVACNDSGVMLYGNTDSGPADAPSGDMSCGGAGQGCCPGSTCNHGFACQGNTCVSCGTLGTACCPGNTCSVTGAVCMNGLCAACGGAGQACCTDNSCQSGGCCSGNLCVGNGQSCGTNLGNCTDGKCASCGALGEACCRGSCAAPSSTCTPQNICASCGGPGDRCCANNTCQSGCCSNALCVAVGAMCGQNNAGTCVMNGQCVVPCGDAGQPCCPGAMCKSNGCCVPAFGMGGVQYSCIADGMTCGGMMGGFGNCQAGSCGGGMCGAVGQPCCMSLFCTGPKAACGGGLMNRMCVTCGGMGEPCCNGQCDVGSCMNQMCR